MGSQPSQTDSEGLIGARCRNCSRTYFPPRDLCPACLSPDGTSPCELPSAGELATWTVVRMSTKFPPPYAIGYVDFEGDVRVLGRIRNWEEGARYATGARMVTSARNDIDPAGKGFTREFEFVILDDQAKGRGDD